MGYRTLLAAAAIVLVSAPALADQVTLKVTHPGNAVGAIKGTGGIWSTCRPNCTKQYERGTKVTLSAETVGNKDISFDRWEGSCKGQGRVCTLTMDGNKTAALHMKVVSGWVDVRVKAVGVGGEVKPFGRVSANNVGTMRRHKRGAKLTLEAIDTPLRAISFVKWGGACASSRTKKTCTITVADKPVVDAHFKQGRTAVLTVTHPGSNVGAVKGTAGIWSTCRPKCEERLAVGTKISLEAHNVDVAQVCGDFLR